MAGLARSCAWLTLAAAILATLGVLCAGKGTDRRLDRVRSGCHLLGVTALLLGVAAFTATSVALGVRIINVFLDLINGFPFSVRADWGFDSSGLATLTLLFGACAVGLMGLGHGRLFTCQLWLAVSMAAWTGVMAPVYRVSSEGSIERTSGTLILLGCLACLPGLFGWAAWYLASVPQDTSKSPGMPVTSGTDWGYPGFLTSCGVILVAVLLLVCYHLAVPIPVGGFGHRTGFAIVFLAGSIAGAAGLILGIPSRTVYLTDLGLVLLSLAVAALPPYWVPTGQSALAETYPLWFTALIVGCGSAAGVLMELARRWRNSVKAGTGTPTTAWMVARARRCGFLVMALALLIGILMAVWPRLPAISATDDTFGRITAGLAANMFLLLIALRAARTLRGYSLQALTLLALATTGGFVLVRMLPFTPRFG